MTIKQFLQTRWKIQPHRIILYPYGAISILAVLFGVISTVFIVMMVYSLHESFKSVVGVLWPVALCYLLIVTFFALFARTKIIFDLEQRIMYKLFLGFIKTTTLPFNDISGIQLLRSGHRGTFRYYVLHKNTTWFNSSTGISSGVINKDSTHAQQIENELLPAIKNFLHTHSVTGSTNYRKK